MKDQDKLRFPVGKYAGPVEYSDKSLSNYISTIANLPKKIDALIEGISPEESNKTYREGGWNVSQVINHLADSHMNSFIRFKLALTENNPQIKPYYEAQWAEMEDAKKDFHDSLMILHGIHNRWTKMLQSMNESDYSRTFFHPESKQSKNLYYNLGMYAWHSDHHLAHIGIALNN